MKDLWSLSCWYDFLLRGIFVMGMLSTLILFGMQAFGWEVTIGIPTIESTFKKR